MQVRSHAEAIDKELNNALQGSGANGSVFQWYLALQIEDVTRDLASNDDNREFDLAKLSSVLPSAPKASLYASDIHYDQYKVQSKTLQMSKNPGLNIQLINCLLPHSLQGSLDEQTFSNEIIENCRWHIQKELLVEKNEKQSQALHNNKQANSSQLNDPSEDSNSNFNAMPSNLFVDTTLENTINASNMEF